MKRITIAPTIFLPALSPSCARKDVRRLDDRLARRDLVRKVSAQSGVLVYSRFEASQRALRPVSKPQVDEPGGVRRNPVSVPKQRVSIHAGAQFSPGRFSVCQVHEIQLGRFASHRARHSTGLSRPEQDLRLEIYYSCRTNRARCWYEQGSSGNEGPG